MKEEIKKSKVKEGEKRVDKRKQKKEKNRDN